MSSRRATLLLYALVLFVWEYAAAQTPAWKLLPGAPSGTSPRFDDISFINERTGWVARATGGIYRTTDAGTTFTLAHSSSMAYPGTNLLAHFRSILFLSDTHGFAGNLGPGSYDTSVHDTNILYETFDGGTNWTRIPGLPETGMRGLCAMYALDSQHIYGAGRVRGPAHFIKSTDGGTHWTVTDLTAAGVMGGLMDVYFRDPTNGFVVGMGMNPYTTNCAFPQYRGAIARTTNGGLTWQQVAADGVNCAYFWKMSWPSPNVGYVSLQQNSTMFAHIYYKTIDGGATWTSNGVPFSAIGVGSFYSQGIGFVTDNEGWVGGDSAATTGNLLRTTDGGASWTPVGSADTLRINRIRFLRPDYAVASGARVAAYRVQLLITTPPQTTNVIAGTNVTLSVNAQGSSTLTYQWRFNSTNLPGATTSAYTILNAQPTNSGPYTVVVGDLSGSLISTVAQLTVDLAPIPPQITNPPQDQTLSIGQDATFTVIATGTGPLNYQWRFYGTNIAGATQTSYSRLNIQPPHAGPYSVVVTNNIGSVTSIVATLTINVPTVLFEDTFDSYASPSIVTSAAATNGYKIFYRTAAGPVDFKAIFGFDYSTVTFPTNIPSAPHSSGGSTKGLFLTVNKDGVDGAAAVNLYPVGQSFFGNFALLFDLWINWRDPLTSTEHTLFGINHSGNVTNRIGQSPSDGLFFAVTGEADSGPASSPRDYSVYRGGGASTPVLMTTNNTVFGPAPLLGPQFDNTNPGFVALFPSKTIPGFGTTPAGTCGMGWIRGEVRQMNNLITWIFNGTIVAQYTNNFAYTNGTLLLGYNDNFPSTGDSNNFAIFDNVRVERIVPLPVQILSPRIQASDFRFSFVTEPSESYTVEWTTNLSVWSPYTNFVAGAFAADLQIQFVPGAQYYYRVRRP